MAVPPKQSAPWTLPNGISVRLVADEAATNKIFKRWVCPDTGCPCHGHAEATGQIVSVETHFQISGEQFRFPGDTGLGANQSEALKCVCIAVFLSKLTEDGDWIEIELTASLSPQIAGQLVPTSMVTLNGNTRAKVMFANGEIGTLLQENGTTLRALINRRTVAQGLIENADLTCFWLDPLHKGKGIEELMRRSVNANVAREPK